MGIRSRSRQSARKTAKLGRQASWRHSSGETVVNTPKCAVEWLRNEQRLLAFCLRHGRTPFVSFRTTETRLETVQIVIAHRTSQRRQLREHPPLDESCVTHAPVETAIGTRPGGHAANGRFDLGLQFTA